MGKVTLKIDSGAVDTCIPIESALSYPIKESVMSKAGAGYRAANGTAIKNHGEKALHGLTGDWTPFKINAQVADVRTPLGSVHHIVKSGNTVVFSKKGNWFMNDQTREKIMIRDRNGSYEIDLWVPSP